MENTQNKPLHISEALRRGLATVTLHDAEGKPLPFVRRVEVQLENSPHFYESIFSTVDDGVAEQMMDNGEIPSQDIIFSTWDYEASEKEFCKGAVEQANQLLGELIKAMNAPTDAVAHLVYGSMYSPKEYNFQTDHTNAYLYYTEAFADALKTWMTEPKRREFLESFFVERFTSRDGFISFVPNHCDDDWLTIFHPREEYNSAQGGQWLGLACYLAQSDRAHSSADYTQWVSDLNETLFYQRREAAENEGMPSQDKMDEAIKEWEGRAGVEELAKWRESKAAEGRAF